MNNFLEILQREDGCISLPRFCAMLGFLLIVGLLIGELFGFEVKHLPEFMVFDSGLFAYCCGSKYLDIKKAGDKL